jgi:hypothetical protein
MSLKFGLKRSEGGFTFGWMVDDETEEEDGRSNAGDAGEASDEGDAGDAGDEAAEAPPPLEAPPPPLLPPPPPPPAAPPALPAAPDVKLEALSAAERGYWELQRLPFDAAELARLQSHYLEPYVAERRIAGARETRSGALRDAVHLRPCAPRARQYYTERLWRALEGLAAAADAEGGGDDDEAAAAGAAAASEGERLPARVELLFWLRVLGRYDASCHREAPPLLLQRAAGGGPGDAEGGGGGVEEVVDLTAEDEEEGTASDVEALLLQRGWAVVGERAGDGRPAAAPVRVKRERSE